MRPLNRNEIQVRTLRFWLLFIVLLAATLVPAYAFVWAAGQQRKTYLAGVQSHRQMLNRQIILAEKTDSLYQLLTLVSAQKVNDYLFLEKYIADQKAGIDRAIGEDSAARFAAYRHLTRTLNTQLALKDSIVKIEAQESILKTDLLSCMARNKNIRREIFSRTQLGSR